MGFLKSFFNQTRRPEGVLGRFMLTTMNPGHAKLADWGLGYVSALSPRRIAELGCGGGRNIAALLSLYPAASVDGVDYSALSVEKARKTNRAAIEAGRCTVREGDVSALDLPAGAYDLATAFETVYFWPGIENCFARVYQILRPGGAFLIVNESDGTDNTGERFEGIIEGMKVYTADELERALKAAGFGSVDVFHHPKKPWIAVKAVREE